MTEVLFITTERPAMQALDDVAAELRLHHQARVRLAIFFDPDDIEGTTHLDEIHRVQFHLSGVEGRRARRFSPMWFLVIARNPIRRRRMRRADAILQPWLQAQSDPWVHRHASAADVLVALDTNAVYCVWELAQRNPAAHAVRGMYEALEVLRNAGTPAPDLAELAASSESPGTRRHE